MSENVLARIFKHNNWANLLTIQVCCKLSDEQLDSEPRSVTKGTIRQTLLHLVNSQQGYLALLTGAERRFIFETFPTFPELEDSARQSGEALITLVREDAIKIPGQRLRTRDNFMVEPWVVLLQVINHATEHREQINSMLNALGVTPPDMDGWSFGEHAHAMEPASPSASNPSPIASQDTAPAS
jgi:uncharacterized damage-inducible protein DinB